MDSWLRPMLSRKQTSVSTSAVERPPSIIDGYNSTEEFHTSRVRTSTRTPSQTSFSGPPTPLQEIFPNYRQSETEWTQPSSEMMIETLIVVMMNKSNMEPVPIEHNSTILHMLEAYSKLLDSSRTQEKKIHMLKLDHAKEMELLKLEHGLQVEDWRTVTQMFTEKERDYQTEIKRLEFIIYKSKGMDTVFAARSNSVVHGSKRFSDTIKNGFGVIKAQYSKTQYLKGHSSRNNSDSSKESFPRWKPATRLNDNQNEYEDREQYFGTQSTYNENKSSSMMTLPDSEPQAPIKYGFPDHESQYEHALESSDSASSDSTRSIERIKFFPITSEPGMIDNPHTTSSGFHDKPLPNIPNSMSESSKQLTLDRFLSKRLSDPSSPISRLRIAQHPMSFSYQPGDDADILTPSIIRDRMKRITIDDHLEQVSNSSTTSRPTTPGDPATRRKPSPLVTIPTMKTSKKAENRKEQQERNTVQRGDSSSSVVTAIRDNSARNSVISDYSGQSGRSGQELRSGNGISEAVTAAARAFAFADRRNGSRESE